MICHDGQGRKCGKTAEYKFWDGKAFVPGIAMCREHAEECLTEYAEKLDLHWIGVPIDSRGFRSSKKVLKVECPDA